jgi:hypothetical protein
VDALTAALRTHRGPGDGRGDGAGRAAPLRGPGAAAGGPAGAERRLLVAAGKAGRPRLIPVSGRFFAAVAAYLDAERPPGAGPHALTSLIAKAQQLLPQAVHDVRGQELTWAEIGELPGTTAATAARRYRTKP